MSDIVAIVDVHDVGRCSRVSGAHNRVNVSGPIVASHSCSFVRSVVNVFEAHVTVGGCWSCNGQHSVISFDLGYVDCIKVFCCEGKDVGVCGPSSDCGEFDEELLAVLVSVV